MVLPRGGAVHGNPLPLLTGREVVEPIVFDGQKCRRRSIRKGARERGTRCILHACIALAGLESKGSPNDRREGGFW